MHTSKFASVMVRAGGTEAWLTQHQCWHDTANTGMDNDWTNIYISAKFHFTPALLAVHCTDVISWVS